MSVLIEPDTLPAYGEGEVEEVFAPPTYSPPSSSRSLDTSLYACARNSVDDGLWKFDTRHMSVNFGPRLWGVDCPVYGLNATIDGTIRILGNPEHVVEVFILLEGTMDLSLPEIGTPSNHDLIFLSHSVNFTPAQINGSSGELSFSIPVPAQVEFQGTTSRTPPTYIRYYYGFVCTIKYTIKVGVVRHGTLKSVDSKTIPIYYLPKSRPPQPPLVNIPRPSIYHDALHIPDFQESDRVRTYQLRSIDPKNHLECKNENNTMFFSLPSPECFTSGYKIPFLLGLVFPSDPALGELYFNKIHITLLKRITICPIGTSLLKRLLTRSSSKTRRRDSPERHRSPNSPSRSTSPHHPAVSEELIFREWQISTGHVKFRSEYAEGICLYRGFIKTGDIGRECSWNLGSAIKVQYVLRVSVIPPDHMEDYLPNFELEETIDLTTDTWEMADRELRSTGGIPIPALGLMKSLDVDSII
ncbi:hypothetical protein K435DRAFT_959333 [Dendrothele bispora CBS 962.96]|uniref:Arrestin-like N-terminal domain-containing protein n=1 Tax=Dendrothele bispora (strain CBS 962.96) TaxID=1314807 RepID=A0A4S8MXC1_DENBC|nr:hypothetical protein K435DRAFT_959333 [Dendrothele bispora CBS 962.96]